MFDCFPKSLFKFNTLPAISIKPREPREKYVPPKNAKKRKNWNFESSIFRSYKKDTDLLMENCFDSDFALGRYPGFIKDKKDYKKVKEFLKNHYREIKQIFKYFSSYSGMDRIMCIGELMITTITSKMKIGEGNPEFNNEVLLAFKNSIFTDRRFSFYQKGCMARYQFLEFIPRLAQKMYLDTKIADSIYKSLELLYGIF